jgi:para-nitrobenzyl esterase
MQTSAVQVATANGRIEGLQFDRHQAFLGIPFAAPPTGALRFGAPQPPKSWSGVRPANKFANSAIQGTSPMPGTAARGPRDEDCLF